jgi:hypothetical protein
VAAQSAVEFDFALPDGTLDSTDVAWRAELGLPIRHPLLRDPSTCLVPQAVLDRLWARMGAAHLELRISLCLSRPGHPVQFGLFVKQRAGFPLHSTSNLTGATPPRVVFPAGAVVTYYGGLLRHRLDIERAGAQMHLSPSLAKSHARRLPGHDYVCDGLPLAWMLRRPVPRDWFDLLTLADADVDSLLPASPTWSAAEVDLFHCSPKGFMCNTANASVGQRNNVRVEYRRTNIGGGLSLDLPRLIAITDLVEGCEVLSPYHNAATARDFLDNDCDSTSATPVDRL